MGITRDRVTLNHLFEQVLKKNIKGLAIFEAFHYDLNHIYEIAQVPIGYFTLKFNLVLPAKKSYLLVKVSHSCNGD